MATITGSVRPTDTIRATDVAIRVGILAGALATAAIHATLGGWLFLANAAGYTVLAVAMIVPLALAARWRWLIRAAFIGFTVATIAGWALFGARFSLAYVDKGIELGLVALLIAEMYFQDGGPANVARRGIDLVLRARRRVVDAERLA